MTTSSGNENRKGGEKKKQWTSGVKGHAFSVYSAPVRQEHKGQKAATGTNNLEKPEV